MAVKQTGLRGVPIHDDIIGELRDELRGALLQDGDAGYERARRLWNAMIDKRPALIARCTSTADVIAAVNFAREHDVLVAVRGGGHNVAGNASNDGGLMIDLSPMKGIRVDPLKRSVQVQPGVNWGELDRETQVHGLMTPGGVVSPTGVAGFTLGGGMGATRRKWGLACDNLISVEIVTAEGQVLTASERQHPDLFWAIRGGGGNFGIVTWFEFQLHQLGPEYYLAAPIYRLEDAGRILREWRDIIELAPDEVTSDVIFWSMPPLPGLSPDLIGAPIIIIGCWYAGPADEGARVLQPLRELGEPLADLSHVGSYVDIQRSFDPFFPDTQRYYWKSLFADGLSNEVLDAIVSLAADRPSPQTVFALRALGGAMSRVPDDATAYSNRDALYNLSIDTTWLAAGDDERMISWTRDAWSHMHGLTRGGVYLNFAGLGEDNERLARGAYGRSYERLIDVKRRYDRGNLFRGNVNIPPSDEGRE